MGKQSRRRAMKRLPLALFIPWDSQGRVFIGEGQFITKDTTIEGGNIIKFPDGVLLKEKKRDG